MLQTDPNDKPMMQAPQMGQDHATIRFLSLISSASRLYTAFRVKFMLFFTVFLWLLKTKIYCFQQGFVNKINFTALERPNQLL